MYVKTPGNLGPKEYTMRKCAIAAVFLLAALFLNFGSEVFGGTIKLKNGDVITGEILKRTGTHIEVKTDYGKLTIPLEKVDSIEKLVRVHVKKDNCFEGEIISRTEKQIRLKTPHGELTIPTADIVKIEPVDGKKTGPAKKPLGIRELRHKALEHLQKKEWQEAIDIYKKIIKKNPDDSNALYNSACAYSLLGKKTEAVEFLRKAVEAGFTDFRHIEADSDLDNIRGEEGYKKLIADKKKYMAPLSPEKIIERYKKRLGDEYKYIKDEKYKLVIISNVGKERLDGLVKGLRSYAEAHWKGFFKFKPDHYITVLIPNSTEEYRKKFGGGGAAGFYNPGTKTLTVNLATGSGTMIHEFTHALHYADLEGLKQRHPIWIVEGFGTLYEQCTIREGSGYGLLNWRLPILKDAIAKDECYTLKDFISKSGGYFRKGRSLSYAITRYIFYFLQEKKLLRKWYAKYRENYKDDRTGLKTLEEIYGKSIDEFEKEWLEFLKPLNYQRRRRVDTNRPFIGVQLEEGDEGLEIIEAIKGGSAEKAGLQAGDIILKMGDKEIKGIDDLRAVVAKHKIGDEVKFVVKRAGEEKEITVKLGKRP
jgi:tetratricopeptide (TPR) repeat protein